MGSVYINILKNNILPFIDELGTDLEYIFQDVNAPVYQANAVKQCADEIFHAQLPDLNR
jgi:hypothetical protein